MTPMLAAVQAETFNIPQAQNWTLAPAVISAEALLRIAGTGAWLVGLGWFVLLNRWRPSRTRLAVGFAALGGMLLSICALPAVAVVKRADAAWATATSILIGPCAAVGLRFAARRSFRRTSG